MFSAPRAATWCGCAKSWTCPDPEIRVPPEAAVLSADADSYMEHILDKWRAPLQNVDDERLERPEYPSRWKTVYSIDAMLEHAVMHPIRHAFQLDELMSPPSFR
jgi:hypothetical protein